jgi:transposase
MSRGRRVNAYVDFCNGEYSRKPSARCSRRPTSARAAGDYVKEWEAQVRESGVPELIKVLDTIERRRSGIENFFQYKVANGMAEGFNNVVGTNVRKRPMALPSLPCVA